MGKIKKITHTGTFRIYHGDIFYIGFFLNAKGVHKRCREKIETKYFKKHNVLKKMARFCWVGIINTCWWFMGGFKPFEIFFSFNTSTHFHTQNRLALGFLSQQKDKDRRNVKGRRCCLFNSLLC